MPKVVKFGGSSLASAAQFQKAGEIIRSEKSRKYVIPSAPGKRNSRDTKITDMLYLCYDKAEKGLDYSEEWKFITSRYQEIIDGLSLTLSLEKEFEQIREQFEQKAGRQYAASRGEYLNGLIMAAYLEFEFVDAADVIFFDKDGRLNTEKTNSMLQQRLENTGCAVIPGFYGSDPDGNVTTFSRGGSDITGSLVAKAVHADLYENWTDVSGFLVADPRIVKDPAVIETITYRELRELSYMGATVLHEDAIFPVRKEGIPINIRNTNRPEDPGTLIVEDTCRHPRFTITGIVGIEHMPSGIDTMTVFVHQDEFESKEQKVLAGIHRAVSPDFIELESDLALIAVVGRGMRQTRGTSGRIFAALSHANVNVKMIDQGSSELNIIIGVRCHDFEQAITAIYDIFVNTQL